MVICHAPIPWKGLGKQEQQHKVETVNEFFFVRARLNSSGGCEAPVTTRVRIGWETFREFEEVLLGSRFPLHGNETWCLKENKKAISRRTERAVVRTMCCRKVVDRKMTEEQMNMLGLKETLDGFAIANGVRWYGHVFKMEEEKDKIGFKMEDAQNRAK